MRKLGLFLLLFTTLASPEAGLAQGYPAPKEGDWIAKDFRFHTGEVMPELRVHYTTIGAPTGVPVLVLHGTTMSRTAMLTPIFSGELFGPGQALDASKYYIVLPDAIGHGKTAKPSDGLRAKFPDYNYDDMVSAQYRLVTEGLGVRHLRMVLGFSMGGMEAWMWGEKYPDFMDTLVPISKSHLASHLPLQIPHRTTPMREIKLQDLKSKTPAELVAFAEENGVENASTMRKQELMFAILKQLAIQESVPAQPNVRSELDTAPIDHR